MEYKYIAVGSENMSGITNWIMLNTLYECGQYNVFPHIIFNGKKQEINLKLSEAHPLFKSSGIPGNPNLGITKDLEGMIIQYDIAKKINVEYFPQVQKNKLYIQHHSNKNKYIELESMFDIINQEKIHTFCMLCASLGAKSISVENTNSFFKSTVSKFNASTNVFSKKLKGDYIEKEQNGRDVNYSTIMKFDKHKIEKSIDEQIINIEDSWKEMVLMRKKYKLKEYLIDYSYDLSNYISRDILIDLNIINSIINKESEEKYKFQSKLYVEFW